MKKHLLIIAFTAFMAVSLTACGKDSETVAAAMATEEAPESVATTSVEETEESEPEETTSEEETQAEEPEVQESEEPTEPAKQEPETKPAESTTEAIQEPEPETPVPETPAPASVEQPEAEAQPVVEQPPVTVSKVSAPGSVDLTQCALAGQEASIDQQLAERVPSEYGVAGIDFHSNSIEYASHSGGAGSYTMDIFGDSNLGYWDLTIINRLVDTGNGFSAVADINCQVLKGICNAICSDGETLYSTIYQNWEGNEDLVQGQWKDYGSFQLKYDIVSGHCHFYIK